MRPTGIYFGNPRERLGTQLTNVLGGDGFDLGSLVNLPGPDPLKVREQELQNAMLAAQIQRLQQQPNLDLRDLALRERTAGLTERRNMQDAAQFAEAGKRQESNSRMDLLRSLVGRDELDPTTVSELLTGGGMADFAGAITRGAERLNTQVTPPKPAKTPLKERLAATAEKVLDVMPGGVPKPTPTPAPSEIVGPTPSPTPTPRVPNLRMQDKLGFNTDLLQELMNPTTLERLRRRKYLA